MATIKRFEDIEAWKMALKISNQIYCISKKGEFSRDYSFRDQIRRATVSIMSNIAEGFESQTQALFITYLARAKASAGEVRSQLYLANNLGYIDLEDFNRMLDDIKQISRSLYNLIKYLRSLANSNRY